MLWNVKSGAIIKNLSTKLKSCQVNKSGTEIALEALSFTIFRTQ